VPHPRRRTGIIRENERLTLALIRLARESILIEGQYFWSRRVTRALVRKIHSMKGKRFEVRIILTDLTLLKALTRQMSAHGYALLGTLEQASKLAGTRLLVGHPHVPHPASPLDPRLTDKRKPVYVHSKVILVDDRFLSVGSTNLAARAFRVDSEVNLTCEALSADEKARLRAFRGALLSHWGLRSAGGLHERSSARIQVVSPLRELERWVLNHPLLSRLPWKALFDPEETWAAGFKRWFRRALPR
jgi:phospholipase D1/2